MKKLITAILSVFLLLTSLLCSGVSAAADVPTADDLDGYENVCLTYTFRRSGYDNGRHYERDLLPYTAYLDKNGNIKDRFFDSYLFLPCMDYGPSGARMHYDANNPTKAIDWTAYVDDTFYSGANVDALEKAYGTTKAALNDKNSKVGVFFTILYPNMMATNFGTLGGKSLNFSKDEDRKYAIRWMIDEQISRFEQEGYKNLDLVGFYWLEEFVVEEGDVKLLQYTADYLHSKGLKFIWIPWYKANGYHRWEELGFDVVCMQPNLMWMGYNDPKRVPTSVSISEQYGMSMEMEVDGKVTQDEYFDRYLNYLEGGLNSSMMDAVKMYYQDGKTAVYYSACYSSSPRYRTVYDLTYKYAKGTLTQSDIDDVRPEFSDPETIIVDDIGMDSLISDDVDWISIGKKYSGSASYVDGNGADYQNVSGKELTDGKLADKALSTDWHAFHNSLPDSQGKYSVTVDLGEVRNDLTDFVAHFDNRMDYGIGMPLDIELSISSNGRSFQKLGSVPLILDSVNSCIKYETEPVSARYVKMTFKIYGGNFVFCSEFLVGVNKDNSNSDTSTDTDSNDNSSEGSNVGSSDTDVPDNDDDSTSDISESPEGSVSQSTSEGTESDISESPEGSVSQSSSEGTESDGSVGEGDVDNNGNSDVLLYILVPALAIAIAAVVIIFFRKKRN